MKPLQWRYTKFTQLLVMLFWLNITQDKLDFLHKSFFFTQSRIRRQALPQGTRKEKNANNDAKTRY